MLKKSLLLLVLVNFQLCLGQNNPQFCKELNALHQVIEQLHYQSKPLNDSLSTSVFNLFVENLDENKRLFTQTQIENFKKADYLQLDNYIQENNCGFISKYAVELEKSIAQAKENLQQLKGKKLDYSGALTLHFSPKEKHTYSESLEKQKQYWQKRISYELIANLTEEDSLLTAVTKKLNLEGTKLKNKLIDEQLCLLDEIINQFGGLQTYVENQFLTAYANYQDPHTTYLSRNDKISFETHLATNQATFGINTFKNKTGEIEISHIVPGSSAFKNGELEEGDLIKKLKSNGDNLVISCVSNKEVVNFLNNEKHHTTSFEVKKKNGPIKIVSLNKTLIKVEENSTRAYILNNTKQKIGYLSIPGFYTDLESPNGLGVANDVAKEIFKLQRENVSGLILDLRNNGGGSMKEAITLSGMFIDKGPISVVKTHKGLVSTLKDPYRGKLYDKPLLILVNHFSASASELFAGTMQDYNRAIVVGTTTFGKSTVQSIFPLSKENDLGFSKITIQKFYRINGTTHQFSGVLPDIVLPDVFDGFKRSEKYLPFALTSDLVKTKMQAKLLPEIKKASLITNSDSRVEKSKAFQQVKKLQLQLKNKYVEKELDYALTVENVFNDISNFQQLMAQLDHLTIEKNNFSVENTSSTKSLLLFNKEDEKLNNEITEKIAKDIYIDEAFSILNELITKF
jgi:carboxyl-terminal processing protease